MSYEVRVTIWCDYDPDGTGKESCQVAVEYERRNRGGLTKSQAATNARLIDKWDVGGDPKRAYCPAHYRKVTP